MGRRAAKNVKEEFVKNAFEYLVQNGLENASVRDLCKAIAISSGSLYYWFDGKDDIYINAAVYGLSKVTYILFDFAFNAMHDVKNFFDTALEEIDKYKMELRFIYQVATSPVYGDRMRMSADELHTTYSKYIAQLSELLGCSQETLRPIVFMFISVILDYVVWEDYKVSKMQLEYLNKVLDKVVNKAVV